MTEHMRAQGTMNRSPKWGALALLVTASGLVLTGCEKKAAPAGPPPPAPVSAMQVNATDVPVTGEWVGTLDGYVNAQIQPQVSGYLVKQNYTEGSQVSKGQVLFEIDPRPFQALVDQAQAQVAQAQGALGQANAQLGLANINVKRDTPLAEARAIAQSQLDTDKQTAATAEASVAAAKAQVQAAQAAVETAKLNLGFTQVRSLISGIAGQATIQVGALVSPQSVLTSVSQVNPIKAYFSISDSEYLGLMEKAKTGGADLLKGATKLPLTLMLSNGQPYSEKGHIVYVDRALNAQTGAIRIAAAFPNAKSELRPGQFGRVKADTEIRHNVVLIPQSAVQELQGIQQVFTVGAGNKVHVVNVQLGQQYGNDWVVNSGLPAGTTIILDNLQKLGEGAPVTPHMVSAMPVNTASPAGR